MSIKNHNWRNLIPFLLFLVITNYSCSYDADLDMVMDDKAAIDEEQGGQDDEEGGTEQSTCADASDFVFNEKEGFVLVEFENAAFSEDWVLKSDGESHSGKGYMVWEGPQHLGDPGNGRVTFKIKIENPATYRFLWHSAVKTGTSGTDHNDSWLRFNDAADFFGQNVQGTSTVYPKDTGKTPNPAGATKDGWFKIYRGGSDLDFKWQSNTFDSNAHNIFVVFENPGIYLMEVSARSSGHGIDKFVLFNDTVTQAEALANTEQSIISCD